MAKLNKIETAKNAMATLGTSMGAAHAEAMAAQIAAVVDALTVVESMADYRVVRSGFLEAYAEASGLSERSARAVWEGLVDATGFVRPVSAAAAAKRAQRAKSGPVQKAAKPEAASEASPVSGVDAASAMIVKTMDTIQREIFEALMARQWALVAKLADEAAEQAPAKA